MFELSETQAMVQQAARSYAQKSLAPIAAQLDREGRFPREQLRELAELGLMGVNVPEEYGGAAGGGVPYVPAPIGNAPRGASSAAPPSTHNMGGLNTFPFWPPQRKVRCPPVSPAGPPF